MVGSSAYAPLSSPSMPFSLSYNSYNVIFRLLKHHSKAKHRAPVGQQYSSLQFPIHYLLIPSDFPPASPIPLSIGGRLGPVPSPSHCACPCASACRCKCSSRRLATRPVLGWYLHRCVGAAFQSQWVSLGDYIYNDAHNAHDNSSKLPFMRQHFKHRSKCHIKMFTYNIAV